jgi:hypothetical protein
MEYEIVVIVYMIHNKFLDHIWYWCFKTFNGLLISYTWVIKVCKKISILLEDKKKNTAAWRVQMNSNSTKLSELERNDKVRLNLKV